MAERVGFESKLKIQTKHLLRTGDDSIEHSGVREFKDQLIESLQRARAAILYFVEMVSIAEKTHAARNGKVGTLTVPSHHYIRGED